MLAKIKALLKQPKLSDASTGEANIRLASAALMVEVATIDNNFDEQEKSALLALLKTQFSLNDEQSQALLDLAEQARHDATSLHQFTREVNEQFSAPQKAELITSMWKVAYADGHLDKYEEHIIRRAADLLHLGHSDFIRAKISAKN